MSEGNSNILERPPSGSAPVVRESSCRKKKTDMNEGFVKDMLNHIDEFVHASYDEHKTCLQKSVRKLFAATRAVGDNSTVAPPPSVVSVLPLHVESSTD